LPANQAGVQHASCSTDWRGRYEAAGKPEVWQDRHPFISLRVGPQIILRVAYCVAPFFSNLFTRTEALLRLAGDIRKFKPLLTEVICPASANFQSLPASPSSQAGQIFRSFKSGYCAA